MFAIYVGHIYRPTTTKTRFPSMFLERYLTVVSQFILVAHGLSVDTQRTELDSCT
jgi:hypothetical protein